MLIRYLDTSVLVALYLPEPMSARAQRLCAKSDGVAISGLSEVEFHSAVARRVRMDDLSREDGLKVLSRFQAHIDDRLYRVAPVEHPDYMLARDWLATFHTTLRTLDALHLATAFHHGFAVVTADRDLARSAKALGVDCRLIS